MAKFLRALIILPFCFWCGTASANDDNRSGFYFGAQGGFLFGATEIDYTDGTDTLVFDGISQEGGIFGLHAGFGKSFNNIYLGLELDIAKTNSETELRVNANTATLTIDHTANISLRAGAYLSAGTLLYGKLGYGMIGWEVDTTDGLNEDDTEYGVSYGVGLETKVAENMTLRSDFTITNIDDISERSGAERLTIDPLLLTATLGISLHF